MDEKTIQILSTKLDTVIKLLALGMTQGKSQKEQIWLMSSAGFRPKEIAETLGTTPNAVRVILFNLRKQQRKGVQRRLEKEE